jgi:NAD(P)-dependent dehydrogenase (short-subunit alcohol dehydrogenase family)
MTTAGEISPTEQVAVVTGGSGAIGSAIVRALRETGHRTVVLDYRAGDIEVDLSDDQATRRAAEQVLERYGRCDVFVHCAGPETSSALLCSSRGASRSGNWLAAWPHTAMHGGYGTT